mgnify:CR=1 FL=1
MAQKILLVEDDPCFGSVLKSYLELSDYEVTLCVNGNDGLEAFRKDKFDICLLDVMMPEMDGFTLGKKIREIDGNVPFVYITAKSMKEDMKQGYEIGADDYIVKPFEMLELLVRIEKVQERTGRAKDAFYMVDKSRSRKEGGSGLGLALCVKVAEIHGGCLKIESRQREGTTVRAIF